MKEFPLVTIGVSACNRKELLRSCLESLLKQSYKNIEIIVVDDGSSDGTAEMMSAEFPQIKYIYQENSGDAAAKNHAARAGKGDYIVFNDSDDLFFPDAVEKLVNALPDKPDACSYGTYQTIDAEGNDVPTKGKVDVYPSGRITGELIRHILVNNCGTLIPRQLFLDKGGFNTALKVSYDYDFFLRLSLESEFYAVQKPVFKRRRHDGNMSSASYEKLSVTASVVTNFVNDYPELNSVFGDIIVDRVADFHNKLRRAALAEGLGEKAVYHAQEAQRLAPSVKNALRLAEAKLKK
ncbi:MAG: glycosyltransferase family 2 protein [Lentisphaeria bacterium]|nr:glycosyltransferase family 2 protein [Lentisphaeria bacterium]